jgi:hypothetical protein
MEEHALYLKRKVMASSKPPAVNVAPAAPTSSKPSPGKLCTDETLEEGGDMDCID